jgi:hypothetical protein
MVQTYPFHPTISYSTTPFELPDLLPDISTAVLIAFLVFSVLGIILTIELYRSAFSLPATNTKKHQRRSCLLLKSDNTSSVMDEPHGSYSSSVKTPLTPTFFSEDISCNIQLRRPATSTSEASQSRADRNESQAEGNMGSLWRQPTFLASNTSLNFKPLCATAKKCSGVLVQFAAWIDRCVDRLARLVAVWTRDPGVEQDLILTPSMEDVDDSLPI